MTTAALEPAGGLHEAWSFEARQALAYSVMTGQGSRARVLPQWRLPKVGA